MEKYGISLPPRGESWPRAPPSLGRLTAAPISPVLRTHFLSPLHHLVRLLCTITCGQVCTTNYVRVAPRGCSYARCREDRPGHREDRFLEGQTCLNHRTGLALSALTPPWGSRICQCRQRTVSGGRPWGLRFPRSKPESGSARLSSLHTPWPPGSMGGDERNDRDASLMDPGVRSDPSGTPRQVS